MFYASRKYKIVCKETCFHVKNIGEKNKVEYKTLEDAVKDGCRCCKDCLNERDGKV